MMACILKCIIAWVAGQLVGIFLISLCSSKSLYDQAEETQRETISQIRQTIARSNLDYTTRTYINNLIDQNFHLDNKEATNNK